jgi:hypothetical protein
MVPVSCENHAAQDSVGDDPRPAEAARCKQWRASMETLHGRHGIAGLAAQGMPDLSPRHPRTAVAKMESSPERAWRPVASAGGPLAACPLRSCNRPPGRRCRRLWSGAVGLGSVRDTQDATTWTDIERVSVRELLLLTQIRGVVLLVNLSHTSAIWSNAERSSSEGSCRTNERQSRASCRYSSATVARLLGGEGDVHASLASASRLIRGS